MNDKNCLFCDIVEKKIETNIISENEKALAFHDKNPMAPTHVLIIPKCHIRSVNQISDEHAPYMQAIMLLAKELAILLKVKENGYRLVINTEKGAGQSVFHLHMHLLAGRSLYWPPG